MENGAAYSQSYRSAVNRRRLLRVVKNWKIIIYYFFKMFQLVEVEELRVDEIYKILANNYVFKGRFKGFRYLDEITTVINRHPDLSLEFDKIHNITIDLLFNRTNFVPARPFYKFVSNHPRWQMERRSVNMFLRRLIGDDYFEW